MSVFWFLVGNRFWCYLLTYLEYNRVVALCYFFFGGNYFLVLHMYLVYNTLVRLCQFFFVVGNSVVAGNSSQNENTF